MRAPRLVFVSLAFAGTVAVAVVSTGCGRDAPEGFSTDPRDGGRNAAPDIVRGDAIAPFFDVGPLDSASVPECLTQADCVINRGVPPLCPSGEPGVWRCQEGQCIDACEGSSCNNDCDCPYLLACLGAICRVANRFNECCDNPMCRAGSFCVEPNGQRGTCPDMPRPDGGISRDAGRRDSGTTETPVGAECQDMTAVCEPNGFCIDEQNGFPGGYCSEDCGGPRAMCPGDAVCRRIAPGQALCLDGCVSNVDCRSGYACIQLGLNMERVCWPIPVGSMNPNGEAIGEMCRLDDDCAIGATCLDPPGPGWDDGYCTQQFCDVMSNPCPSGSLCYNVPGLFSLCLVECPNGGSRSTCRMGYYCLGPQGMSGVCTTN